MGPMPFEVSSANAPLVIMQGEINGRPVHVVLDTGNSAPFTVLISPAEASAASVTVNRSPKVAGNAIGPEAISIQSGTLRSFRVGDIALKQTDAGITDAPDHVSQALGRPVEAIVGWNFLRTRTVRIDYPARQIDLTAAPGPTRNAARFSVTPKRRLMTVQVEVNGKGPFTFAIDTGASNTLISAETAERAGVTSAASVSNLKGGGGIAGPATRGSPSNLTLAGVTREAVRPVIVNFLPKISEAAGAPLDGVVGADVLSRGKLTIDFPRTMLWLNDQ